MKNSKWLVIIIFFGLISVMNTFGQDFYIGVKLGLSLQGPEFKDAEIDYNADTDILYGFRLGVKVLTFGLEANYFEVEHHFEAEEGIPPELELEKMKMNYFGLNALYFFQIPVVQPYLTAGYGSYGVDAVGLDKDRSGGFNLGVGAYLPLGNHISFMAEAKYHWVSFELGEREMSLDDYTWNISFNYLF